MSEAPLLSRLREFLRNVLVLLLALSFVCGLPGVGEGLRTSLDQVGHHCACPVGLDGCSCAVGQTAHCHEAKATVDATGQPALSHRCLEQDTPILSLAHLPLLPTDALAPTPPDAREIPPIPAPNALIGRLRERPRPPPLVS